MNRFKEAVKGRGVALIALLMLMAGTVGFPGALKAASYVGTVNGTGYNTLEALISAVKSSNEATIIISMSKNWDAAENAGFNRLLEIPSGKSVILNMNGHIFNRNLAHKTSSRDGELIYLNSNSTLMINGGESSSSHNVWVHSSTDTSKYATTKKTVTGGTLSGGSSSNSSGGIYANSGCNITLNNVTIAGCRADYSWGSGYGGGIWAYGSNINLTLNNTTITGCFAYYGGGGIYYSSGNYLNLDMKDSHVDSNYAGDDGGGIKADGKYLYLTGDGNSTLSGNNAKAKGGGIYGGSNQTISGLTINGNKAGEGGGIYAYGTGLYLSNLKILENDASRGGGIFAYNNSQTIASCMIRENSGHGVYLGAGVKTSFKISGSTVIEENTDAGKGSNLYLSAADWSDNRITFELSKPAKVYISYKDGGHDEIMVTEEASGVKARDCTQFLFSDQAGYYFGFDPAPEKRKIMRYKGTRPAVPEAVKVPAADANDATKTGGSDTKAGIKDTISVGGMDFNLLRGFFRHVKGDSYEENSDAVFYYSDGLFFEDPATYNSHLATLSLSLANSSMYLNGPTEPVEGNSYYDKHIAARQFLADIGCSDRSIYLNDSYINKPLIDSIGVIMGNKALAKSDGTDTGKILLPVVIRSGGYESEWGSNMTLGDSQNKEHSGFAKAADKVFDELMAYITDQGLTDKYNNGNIKFWLVGFSRGGATANITAKRLVEKISSEGKSDEVFAYCCEAPKGGHDRAETLNDKTKYYCIHNLINTVDLVPYVGPEQMGIKRYGVDHYIPGTDRGPVQSSSVTVRRGNASNTAMTVTTYADNSPLETKSSAYDNKRTTMLTHLKAIDSAMVFDDYFNPMSMSFVPVKTFANGNYEGNLAEDYVKDLIRFLQEGTSPGDYDHFSQAVRNRDVYFSDYQQALRNIIGMLYSMDPAKKDGFTGKASTIADRMSYSFMIDVYFNLIGKWHTLDSNKRKSYVSSFWDLLKGTGALSFLNDKEKKTLEAGFPALVDMMMRLLDADNAYKPGDNTEISKWAKGMTQTMAYIATLVSYSGYILSCHYPEVDLAWARSYDSWYANETREYEISLTGLNMEAPGAYIMDGGTERALSSEGTNNVTGFKKLILDRKDIVGEAIYYDITDSKTGTTLKNKVYRGGVDLAVDKDVDRTYTVKTYAISYGIQSRAKTYTIKVTASSGDTYDLDSIPDPMDIENIEYGSDLTAFLPRTVRIVLTDGTVREAGVTWDDPVKQSGSSDPRDETEYGVDGTITLPDDVDNPRGVNLEVFLTMWVKGTYRAFGVEASIPSGEVLSDFFVTLSTDESGGIIYYTTDGSDPTDASIRYKGEAIPIRRADAVGGIVTLKAITYKAGLWESNISAFSYSFGWDVPIPLPANHTYNGRPQVGIPASPFYKVVKITGGGVKNARGDATGTRPGTYRVTLRLNSGYRWLEKINDDGSRETSTGDKVISFTIKDDGRGSGGGGYHDDDDDYSGSGDSYTNGILPTAGVSLLPGGRPAAVNGPVPTVSRRGKIGWEAIKDLLLEGTDKDVKVEMNGTTVVPADILESIRGKDITLSLEMGNGFTWIIKGTDIGPGALKDINLGVKKDRGGIPVDVYNAITGENYSIAISLESTGDFGFKAALSLDLERKNAGLYANLFYYNPSGGKAEFISAGLIGEDGTALLEFTHASDYLIVINKEVLDPGRGGKNEKSAQAESDKGEVTSVKARTIPIWFIVIMVVVLLAGAFGVYCIYRRR